MSMRALVVDSHIVLDLGFRHHVDACEIGSEPAVVELLVPVREPSPREEPGICDLADVPGALEMPAAWNPPKEVLWIGGPELRRLAEAAALGYAEPPAGCPFNT